MLRWRKVAHAIGPRKRQLMRDQQDDIRELKNKGQSKGNQYQNFAKGHPIKYVSR